MPRAQAQTSRSTFAKLGAHDAPSDDFADETCAAACDACEAPTTRRRRLEKIEEKPAVTRIERRLAGAALLLLLGGLIFVYGLSDTDLVDGPGTVDAQMIQESTENPVPTPPSPPPAPAPLHLPPPLPPPLPLHLPPPLLPPPEWLSALPFPSPSACPLPPPAFRPPPPTMLAPTPPPHSSCAAPCDDCCADRGHDCCAAIDAIGEPATCSNASLFSVRTGDECNGHSRGAFRCCVASGILEPIQRTFASHGFLSKSYDQTWLERALSPTYGAAQGRPRGVAPDALAPGLVESFPTLEADCGPRCSALTWVSANHPLLVVDHNHGRSWSLWFEASDEVWGKVQCMTVADAVSNNRECCGRRYAEYCDDVCPEARATDDDDGFEASEDCKLRSAGCNWHEDNTGCPSDALDSGTCAKCKLADWCTDAGVLSGGTWVRRFFWERDKDGSINYDSKQCHYRPSELREFADALGAFGAVRTTFQGGDWNEVRASPRD